MRNPGRVAGKPLRRLRDDQGAQEKSRGFASWAHRPSRQGVGEIVERARVSEDRHDAMRKESEVRMQPCEHDVVLAAISPNI